MGTIYLKADLSNVTAENINQFNIDQLECDEVNDFIRAGHRNLLLQIPTTVHVQYYIHRNSRLTQEECEQIIRNSTELWDDIGQFHDYSTEFLMEHGEKLSRINIEGQRNITPEFVRLHMDRLNVGSVLQYRERIGDVLDFLVTPEMCGRYLRRHMSWSSSKESLLQALANCGIEGEKLQTIHQFVNNWYDTPVDAERLVSDYQDQDRAQYSIAVVTDFWRNNSRKQKYANWEEYANECKQTHADGLANTWYGSFFREPMAELLGYND